MTPAEITDDTPLLLDVAARLAFPGGSVSGLTLRNAARRGDLDVERVGRHVYTTLAAIREMRARCRDRERARAHEQYVVEPGATEPR